MTASAARPGGTAPAGERARLSASTLVQAGDAVLPAYDRSPAPPITHLGVGAFARAHLGVYADDLLRQGWPATVCGVSLRSRRAEDQLAPQDGLYTVVEREPDGDAPLRVIGALADIATGPAAAVEAIAAPTTRLVTLTVTEKGYEPDAEEPARPDRPRSAAQVLAAGLASRRATGAPPPVVASLDNLADNGTVLRGLVLEAADRLDPALPSWIADEVRFPRSVVDRMAPATTSGDLDEVASRLGLVDHATVIAERHRSWVVEATEGLPPLADVGVEVVPDAEPYQRRKLWLLNGPHSALAYLGLVADCTTIADATGHPLVAPFVQRLVDDILAAADFPAALQPAAFARAALHRFRNPALGHTCVQVGADGSRKLPQRLFPVVAERRRRGLGTGRFVLVAAAWVAATAGIPVQGATLPAVDDPAAELIRAAAATGGPTQACATALGPDGDRWLVAQVSEALRRLARDGVGALESQP